MARIRETMGATLQVRERVRLKAVADKSTHQEASQLPLEGDNSAPVAFLQILVSLAPDRLPDVRSRRRRG
jgi:hypothetical protein